MCSVHLVEPQITLVYFLQKINLQSPGSWIEQMEELMVGWLCDSGEGNFGSKHSNKQTYNQTPVFTPPPGLLICWDFCLLGLSLPGFAGRIGLLFIRNLSCRHAMYRILCSSKSVTTPPSDLASSKIHCKFICYFICLFDFVVQ